MSTVAIIVAAGEGNRAGGKVPKQWRTIAGKLVIDWSVDAFKNHDLVDFVVVVLPPNKTFDRNDVITCTGGNSRSISVYNGLKAAKNLAPRLATFLKEQTDIRWIVSVVSTGGRKTIDEERLERDLKLEEEVSINPIVRAVFDHFPASKFYNIENFKNESNSKSVKSDMQTNAFGWDPLEKE